MTGSVRLFALSCVVAPLIFGATGVSHAETLRMGGTGAAHELLKQLGAAYAAEHPEMTFEVVPGLGSSGGLKALSDKAIDIAVAARPLKSEETAKGLKEFARGRTAFLLATSRADPQELKSREIASVFASAGAKWPDGTPIRLVLRPESESDSKLLQEFFPGMEEALKTARSRSEIPVAMTDLDNTSMAVEMKGSLTAATLVQLETQKSALRAIKVDGVEPTLENLESGVYPYSKTLHFVVAEQSTATAKDFAAFLISDEAGVLMRAAGILPLEPRPAGL